MKLIYLVLIVVLFGTKVFAQEKNNYAPITSPEIKNSYDSLFFTYFYEPLPLQVGESIMQIGGAFTLLPTPDLEEYPIPAIEIQYKYGLMENFSIVSSLSTNYFSSLLHLGLQWNIYGSCFSFGIANHIGGFVGTYHLDMFDENFAYSVMDMPIIRFGIRADEFSTSISMGATYIFTSGSRVGDLSAPGPKCVWNDFSFTLAIEQPILRKTIMSLGLNLEFSRSPYQAWFFMIQ